MNDLYLEDFSNEDIIKNNIINTEPTQKQEDNIKLKPTINLKPEINNKGEKIVIFSINIPFDEEAFKIDIMINDDLYKNIGKYFSV